MITDMKGRGIVATLGCAALLSLTACVQNQAEQVEDVASETVETEDGGTVTLREAEMDQTYQLDDHTIQINSIDFIEDQQDVAYFYSHGVHVNATIANSTDEPSLFDLWSHIRLGDAQDPAYGGSLQLRTYEDGQYDLPELNDEWFIELDAGEDVTVDLLFDVPFPEEEQDIHVIVQEYPAQNFSDVLVWSVDGWDDVEPIGREEVDWDEIEENEAELEDVEELADEEVEEE